MKLEFGNYDGPIPHRSHKKQVKVTLSRRNLLALQHKLEMQGSARRLETDNCWTIDEFESEWCLVICCETDDEHYQDRLAGPAGVMHEETEVYILRHDLDSGNL